MPGGNPNHDPKNGEFTTGAGGGAGGGSAHGKIGTRTVLKHPTAAQLQKNMPISDAQQLASASHHSMADRMANEALPVGTQSYRTESEARSVANSLKARGFQAQVREGGTFGYQVAHNAPSAGAHQVHDYIMAKGGPSPNVSAHNVIGTRHVGGKRKG